MTVNADIIRLVKSLESMSKRLRKVEIRTLLPFSDAGGSFLSLLDTPDTFAGHAGWNPSVNTAEDALVFGLVGSSCVTFVCGTVGWRATGGVEPRTLVHEIAFQTTDEGNDRGIAAVDLQWQLRNDNDVAGSEWSCILGGKYNNIEPTQSELSNIRGYENEIWGNYSTNIVGDFNEAHPGGGGVGGANVTILGSSNWVQWSEYTFIAGIFNEVQNNFGATVFGAGNQIDGCIYSATLGLDNEIFGYYNWAVYIFGEKCLAYSTNIDFYHRTYYNFIHGLHSYIENVNNNFLFGQLCKSYDTQADGGYYFNTRMILNGDEPNSYNNQGQETGGYNQASRFAQNDLIEDWSTSWISSRFQFPLLNYSVWAFVIEITGTEQSCANVYKWQIQGLVKNVSGTFTLLWSVVTNLHRDVITKEWQVIADDANDRLVFQFRDTAGPDTTNCNIQMFMQTIEVGYD